MTEMDELKPCPFCGSRDIATDGPSYTLFMCNDCGGQIYDQDSHAEAIAAWNRRPSLSPAGVTEEEARAFAVAYAKACNHRYDMGAIRAGLEAAAKAQPSSSTGQGEPVAWPKRRANIPFTQEAGEKRRVVGFVIEPGDEAYGEYGLSEPLSWLERMCSTHPSLPAGHVAVPVEPTEEMVEAFMAEMGAQGVALDDFSEPIYPAKLYRAMLAALPHNQGEGK